MTRLARIQMQVMDPPHFQALIWWVSLEAVPFVREHPDWTLIQFGVAQAR